MCVPLVPPLSVQREIMVRVAAGREEIARDGEGASFCEINDEIEALIWARKRLNEWDMQTHIVLNEMNRRHEWRQRNKGPSVSRGHGIRCPIFGHEADRIVSARNGVANLTVWPMNHDFQTFAFAKVCCSGARLCLRRGQARGPSALGRTAAQPAPGNPARILFSMFRYPSELSATPFIGCPNRSESGH